MTPTIDRGRFFAAIRTSGVCGDSLSQIEVDGLNGILDAATKYALVDLRHIAYPMATAWHEARLNAGIREIGRGSGRAYGKPAGPYGQVYYGRGPCQLTWYENYVKFGKLLGVDLARYPDKALEPETGAAILILGSRDGLFRAGHTLARYFGDHADDPAGARDIINGDVAKNGALIAGYHAKFLAALRAAASPVASIAPAPAPGFLARLHALFVRKAA